MPIPDKTLAKRPRESEEDKDEATTLQLCELATALAKAPSNNASGQAFAEQTQSSIDFQKIIKRSLHQKNDDVLYDALARTETIHRNACLLLKEALEEAAEVVIVERAEGKKMEINAFAIPVFIHTTGGLKKEQCFQDQLAFEHLRESIKAEGLESPDACVVLVNHGYHANEMDAITYSHLHEMLRDAFAAMTDKRIVATPAIDRSFGGWPDNAFMPNDHAVELRFLLGFALKAVDDPFYIVPTDEAAADSYFSARLDRFEQWVANAAPLARRCFGLDPLPKSASGSKSSATEDIHFLYQDLFHGAKERAIAEYFTLELISELNRSLQGFFEFGETNSAAGSAALIKSVVATIGAVDRVGESAMRVQLRDQSGKLIIQTEKPLPMLPDWQDEFADTVNALAMIGVTNILVAKKFQPDGQAVDAAPYCMQD